MRDQPERLGGLPEEDEVDGTFASGVSLPVRGADVMDRVSITVGDLVALDEVDGIVNAANAALDGGGGNVDAAVHAAAGGGLAAHTAAHHPGGCAVGLAIVTPAFDLERRGVRRIVHTVAPVWEAGAEGEQAKLGYTREDVLLASCYMNSLKLAAAEGLKRLAFAPLSTELGGFPKERAAKIALGHVLGYLLGRPTPELPAHVAFCCRSEPDALVLRHAAATRTQWMLNRTRA